MSYTVLARRYRSNTFDEVIGQEPVARTLMNAIGADRVAHAYLFCGTRGVGKTTMARLFARALNAPDSIPQCPKLGENANGKAATGGGKKKKKTAKNTGDDGQTEYPAKDVQQRMAQAIMRGDDLNVIEIDGASNRGVDEARQLIANAGLAPTGNALFKVYIIDEVHMLTREAFNALLKTMEEPPSHVKFILCTTEPHKVPATIQSRCQRFDFRNIPTARIAEHLKTVLKGESKKAKDEVIWQVARLGNGSMRDALSLMDRLLATGEDELTAEILEQMLGLPPEELIVALVDAFAAGDVASALQRAAELMQRGVAEQQLVEVLIERLRQLMLVTACGPDSELVELSDESKKVAAEQAAKFDAAGLVHMIALCENLDQAARRSSSPRALLDATIVRLALAEKMADVTALLAGGGGSEKKKPAAGAEQVRRGLIERATAHGAPTSPPLANARGRTTTPTATDSSTSSPPDRPASASHEAPPPTNASPSAPPQPAADAQPPTDAPVSDAPSTAQPFAPPSPSPRDIWAGVLRAVSDKPSLSWVRSLALHHVDGQTARVAPLPGKQHVRRFIADRQRQQLADLMRPLVDRPVKVELIDQPPAKGNAQRPGGDGDDEGSSPGPSRPDNRSGRGDRNEAMKLPLVQQVLEAFNATLIDTFEENDTR